MLILSNSLLLVAQKVGIKLWKHVSWWLALLHCVLSLHIFLRRCLYKNYCVTTKRLVSSADLRSITEIIFHVKSVLRSSIVILCMYLCCYFYCVKADYIYRIWERCRLSNHHIRSCLISVLHCSQPTRNQVNLLFFVQWYWKLFTLVQ